VPTDLIDATLSELDALIAAASAALADTSSSALPESFPAPHESQLAVIESAKRFNVLNCGRRYGKTEMGKRLLAERAAQGQRTAYLAPSYPMTHQFYREMADALYGRTKGNEANKRIGFPNGGFIDIWSLEDGGNRVRGQKYHRVVLDECALVIGLMGIWEKVVRPTLTDYRGDAWFLSTPKRGSDFETLYRRTDPDWRSWTLTTEANPFIPRDEIEAARKGLSEQAFAQEYLAQSEASESDLVLPEFDASLHVRPALATWQECKWRVVGVDPGGGDPTAVVPLGVSKTEHVHQYGEFYRKGDVAVDDVISYIGQLNNLARVDLIVVDPSAKGWVEQLQRYGYPAMAANNARGAGLESVRWLLQSGRLTIGERCTNSISEFGSYRWAKRRDQDTGERYATSTAEDNHADAMDARRYAVMAILNGLPSGAAPRQPIQFHRSGATRFGR